MVEIEFMCPVEVEYQKMKSKYLMITVNLRKKRIGN